MHTHVHGAQYSLTRNASAMTKNKVVILAIVGLSIFSYVGQHFKALSAPGVTIP